jgi:tetratricopeptide (TPR) repeat protein
MKKQIKKEDVDFELAFYNGLIEKNPNFVEALVALGELYTDAGMYKEGLTVDEKLVQLRPNDPVVHYNLACSYSLLNDVNKAYRSVKKAIHCGYSDFEYLRQDDDLSNLWKDHRFQQYLSRITNKNPSAKQG